MNNNVMTTLMANKFNLYDNPEVRDVLNNTYKDITAHCYKQGNNVRLFGDAVAQRAEIWKPKKTGGYDIYVGIETPLYNIAKCWTRADANAHLKHSKNSEIALENISIVDLCFMLDKLEHVSQETETPKAETPKAETPKRGKGKGKGKANAQAEAV